MPGSQRKVNKACWEAVAKSKFRPVLSLNNNVSVDAHPILIMIKRCTLLLNHVLLFITVTSIIIVMLGYYLIET